MSFTIERSKGCNNSPKNAFVEEYTVAFLQQNTSYMQENSTEDYVITMLGNYDFPEILQEIEQVRIIASISHGKFGSSTGELMMNKVAYAFAFQYEFATTTKKIVKQATVFLMKK